MQKCPDDYGKMMQDRLNTLPQQINGQMIFFDAHPGATLSDWSAARYQFWVDNNCTAALERYETAKDGNADPATMEMTESVIQEAKDNPTQ